MLLEPNPCFYIFPQLSVRDMSVTEADREIVPAVKAVPLLVSVRKDP